MGERLTLLIYKGIEQTLWPKEGGLREKREKIELKQDQNQTLKLSIIESGAHSHNIIQAPIGWGSPTSVALLPAAHIGLMWDSLYAVNFID